MTAQISPRGDDLLKNKSRPEMAAEEAAGWVESERAMREKLKKEREARELKEKQEREQRKLELLQKEKEAAELKKLEEAEAARKAAEQAAALLSQAASVPLPVVPAPVAVEETTEATEVEGNKENSTGREDEGSSDSEDDGQGSAPSPPWITIVEEAST
ncbi:hypothetical protein C8Q80DRAFT_855592 [Daedaleopsis nitida]|nr:hypothetical protein C8Q80DRAFT_855592 [Daedaleopsis nitida]